MSRSAAREEEVMQQINFYAGEQRHIKLRFHVANDVPFTIRAASWALLWAGQPEAEGECIIDGDVIDAFIAPVKRTDYELRITYYVADETRVEAVKVVVT